MITRPTYWHPWRIKLLLKEMLEKLESETDPKTWHITLGGTLVEYKVPKQRWSEWAHEHADDPEITEPMKRIFELFESRLNEGAVRGKLNFVQVIFNLKNNYGWKDDPGQSARDESRLDLEIEATRNRLAGQRRDNLLPDGNSTHPGSA